MYNSLKLAVESGSTDNVCEWLRQHTCDVKHDIHAYFCTEDAPAHATSGGCRCEALLSEPLRRQQIYMIRLLLGSGVFPSAKICASDYPYGGDGDRSSTPIKRAVESGSLDDVHQLLTSEGAAADDVNVHPSACIKHNMQRHWKTCSDCDSPLMAAVRRQDVAMMRLLLAHGAKLSAALRAEFWLGLPCFAGVSKTALIVAVETGNEEVITELLTSGADVNEWLGQVRTVMHNSWHLAEIWKYFWIVKRLVELGADPNDTNEEGGNQTALLLVLWKHHLNLDDSCSRSAALTTMNTLLPVTRDLSAILAAHRCIRLSGGKLVSQECVLLFLQHGARIRYCDVYLTGSSAWATKLWISNEQHSERFIEFVRAADTDFSGVRQRIASVNKDEWAPLNLAVLDRKLSQPLTLQASCIINVRCQLGSVRDCDMWARIDQLPLPPIMRDRMKLKVW